MLTIGSTTIAVSRRVAVATTIALIAFTLIAFAFMRLLLRGACV